MNYNKLKSIVKAIDDARVKDIKIYETYNISPFFDYQIIATSQTSRQMRACYSHLQDEAKENNFIINHVEGLNSESWMLIDLGDIIVNVFSREDREKYNLDHIWFDLKQIDVNKLFD